MGVPQEVGSADNRRRPLKTRSKRWAQGLAAGIARTGVTPNQMSVLSLVFALGGATALVAVGQATSWPWRLGWCLGAAAGIQLRLLCNMLDGMVAMEGDKRTPVGDLYNEVPDRLADLVLLIGAGYAATASPWPGAVASGYVAAGLAVLTAYVRALGASLGTPQFFQGPMAKPHRMFTLTLTCLIAAASVTTTWWPLVFHAASGLMILGMVVTLLRRLRRIAADLRRRDGVAS